MTQVQTELLAGTRVLVVEDEYYLADDLSRTLVQAGAKVVGPVASIKDASDKLNEGAFDCAILDMNLRGDFAFDVAKRLKEAGVPFIVATGYNQTSLPESLANVPKIEKPFSPHQVVELLARLR